MSGIISFQKSLNLFVCVGGRGRQNEGAVGKLVNCGGWSYGAARGGGSTDIRLVCTNWYDFESLKSRIIVAGGGGGAENSSGYGGYAGSLVGGNGKSSVNCSSVGSCEGGSQTSGYNFGIAYYPTHDSGIWGGGGNGYYSGYTATVSPWFMGGGGGSSFISGYTGCNAISANSTENNIVHTGLPNHYSGYVFSNAVMKAGNEVMPSPKGGTETGHTGNGYAIIRQQ